MIGERERERILNEREGILDEMFENNGRVG